MFWNKASGQSIGTWSRRAALASLAIGAAALAVAPGKALAQKYPDKPVRIIVPYAAGGGTDTMARFLAKQLEKELGQTFVVENRSGSGTTIGATYVSRADPDGYTILLGTSSTFAIAVSLYKNLAYDPTKNFTPIALIAEVPFVLVVNPKFPAKTLKELVALLKAKPGEYNYASGGVGSPHHVYAELLKSMTGTDMKNVIYRGGAPALKDIIAGHVPMGFADAGQALSVIKAGTVRPLGVSTAKRLDTLPDVPAIGETVKGYEASAWIAIVGPAGIPAPIVKTLNDAFNRAMVSPETKAFFDKVGWTPLTSTPQQLEKHIASEIKRWAGVLKAAGVKAK